MQGNLNRIDMHNAGVAEKGILCAIMKYKYNYKIKDESLKDESFETTIYMNAYNRSEEFLRKINLITHDSLMKNKVFQKNFERLVGRRVSQISVPYYTQIKIGSTFYNELNNMAFFVLNSTKNDTEKYYLVIKKDATTKLECLGKSYDDVQNYLLKTRDFLPPNLKTPKTHWIRPIPPESIEFKLTVMENGDCDMEYVKHRETDRNNWLLQKIEEADAEFLMRAFSLSTGVVVADKHKMQEDKSLEEKEYNRMQETINRNDMHNAGVAEKGISYFRIKYKYEYKTKDECEYKTKDKYFEINIYLNVYNRNKEFPEKFITTDFLMKNEVFQRALQSLVSRRVSQISVPYYKQIKKESTFYNEGEVKLIKFLVINDTNTDTKNDTEKYYFVIKEDATAPLEYSGKSYADVLNFNQKNSATHWICSTPPKSIEFKLTVMENGDCDIEYVKHRETGRNNVLFQKIAEAHVRYSKKEEDKIKTANMKKSSEESKE